MSRMGLKSFSVVAALVLSSFSIVSASGFIRPLTEKDIGGSEATVTLMDGEEHSGTVRTCLFIMNKLKWCTLKDGAGEKVKYKAEDIQGMRVKISELAKAGLFAGGSLVDAITADYEEMANREFVSFERVRLPGKKAKPRLMQMVNPGFDERYKVYHIAGGSTSGGFMGITATSADSYMVVKDGGQGFKAEEDGYKKKQFEELFGDCAVMTTAYPTKKEREWESFAEHVFIYNKKCKP